MKNALLYHLASGDAFFSGSALIVIAIAWVTLTRSIRWKWCYRLFLIVGVLLVTLSATPLPIWLYSLLVVLTLAWLVANGMAKISFSGRVAITVVAVAGWLGAIAWEVPYHLRPTLPPVRDPVLGVIGDSVTAGVDEGRYSTWPQLLAHDHSLTINDFSKVAATTATAQQQAKKLDDSVNLVLVEIGGNDLLGSTNASTFERDLEALLQQVCVPSRTVVMFELPLLPFCNAYGRAQRELCAAYDVALIPKGVFLRILLAGGATSDSIHLTAKGHQAMAAEVWHMISPVIQRQDGER